jgi:hypothetical protein
MPKLAWDKGGAISRQHIRQSASGERVLFIGTPCSNLYTAIVIREVSGLAFENGATFGKL